MRLLCHPELISDNISEKMSLNLWNCSCHSACLGGKKAPFERRALEDDPETGEGKCSENKATLKRKAGYVHDGKCGLLEMQQGNKN